MKLSLDAAYALHAMLYMVRHASQLPDTTYKIAKAEGIPAESLSRVFRRLTGAGFIRFARSPKQGYVFAGPPGDISLMELFEAIEEEPLLDDCPLRHCQCGGTPGNCRIFARWVSATRRIKALFEETTIADAAQSHPEHVFHVLPNRHGRG